MAFEFTKMQGLGNDFVVVDRRAHGSPVSPEEAIRLCDRHRGIGADGVLSVLGSALAPVAMHVTNPDGSVAEMCGNGLRCVVRWSIDHGLLPAEGGTVETGRGVLRALGERDGQVRIEMGRPILEPPRIPVRHAGDRVVEQPIEAGNTRWRMTCVSMGNPHAVIFTGDAKGLRTLALEHGPVLERHPWFPHRTNVGFAFRCSPVEFDLVVWERGAGLTLACGTGACAAVVAAVVSGRAPAATPVTVHLPGGSLRIEVAADLSEVWMSGPAETVFTGRV